MEQAPKTEQSNEITIDEALLEELQALARTAKDYIGTTSPRTHEASNDTQKMGTMVGGITSSEYRRLADEAYQARLARQAANDETIGERIERSE